MICYFFGRICINNAFLQFSEEKLSKFSGIFSKFPINCHFRPNPQKIKAWIVKLERGIGIPPRGDPLTSPPLLDLASHPPKNFGGHNVNNAFFAILLRNLFKNFENFDKISKDLCFLSKRAKIEYWVY